MSEDRDFEKKPEIVSDIRPMITDLLVGYDNLASEWDQDNELPASAATSAATTTSSPATAESA